ncbi:MAG: FkbM family methyltransferase [Thermoplasmata archaeon]|nr:FkbM family methyltransferase [Thermoplasmata archaeon]
MSPRRFFGRFAEFVNDSAMWGTALENPRRLLLARLGWGGATLRFHGGFTLPYTRQNRPLVEDLLRLAVPHGAIFGDTPDPILGRWRVQLADGTITTPTGLRFTLDSFNATIFAETFIYQTQFRGFDLSNATVVDVGANVGDTALYYASLGASVVAVEPDPVNFERLRKNLALNPTLSGKIRPIAAAVGDDGEVEFHAGLGGGSGLYAAGGRTVRVRSMSLGTLLAESGWDAPFLLKCDCKGCEFTLVRDPALRRFRNVAIEYAVFHPTDRPEAIHTALGELGFTRRRVYKHNFGAYTFGEYGTIHAQRDEAPRGPD